ncbi:MAG: penicillin-binding protein 2 [Candidatus Omnitrophota bacterium]
MRKKCCDNSCRVYMMTRIKIYSLILFVNLCVLLSGLVYIQIAMHDRYKVMSEENRLKVVPMMAPRGRILDRKGNVLAKDVLCFKVSVIYDRIKDIGSLADSLSAVLDIPVDKIIKDIKEGRKQPYSPLCIVSDIGLNKAIPIEELTMNQPGLLLEVSSRREYLNGSSCSNVLGYVGFINRSEFEKMRHYGFEINDLVGRDGIEKYYDNYLRGKHGGKQVEVDHRGRKIAILGLKEPIAGRDAYLTIDLDLQKFCEEFLKGRKGAIVAMNPGTGEILAMASAPDYDPGIFIDNDKKNEREKILRSAQYPLLNRAIAVAYPPGSVFKAVVAVAGLESKIVSEQKTFVCPGYLELGKWRFGCWRKNGHGPQSVTSALKNSCNVYFFNLGLLLGVDRIAQFSERFGFGLKAGIDLPGENKGNRPTAAWKKKKIKESWYKGDTVNYSIGQGYLLVSPLQIARMMSVFANGGYLVKPYLVTRIEDISMNRAEKVNLRISGENLEIVRQGLKKVVNDSRGTGMNARLNEIVVAGKTGTAQTSEEKNHGWFAGFAPYDNPSLTVVVFEEYGGRGGYFPAETARDIFQRARELGII